MNSETFDVLIVENSETMLKSLESIFAYAGCMKIVGVAKNDTDATDMLNDLSPRCVVINKTKKEHSKFLNSIESQRNIIIVDIDRLH